MIIQRYYSQKHSSYLGLYALQKMGMTPNVCDPKGSVPEGVDVKVGKLPLLKLEDIKKAIKELKHRYSTGDTKENATAVTSNKKQH